MSSNELEVEKSLCLRCTVDTHNWPDDQHKVSSEFRFQGVGWKFKCEKVRGHYGLHLRKCSGVNPDRPPLVSVHMESFDDSEQRVLQIRSQETNLGKRELEGGEWIKIWVKKEQEIPGSVADFVLQGVFNLIVFLKGGEESSTVEQCVQSSLTFDPVPCSDNQSEDFYELLCSRLNPDVNFHCGGQSTKAHSLIVGTRSPVLASLLQRHSAQYQTEIVIKIEDIDLGTLRLFLRYLYTARLDGAMSFETAMALYEAARKYQVPRLARRCRQSLIEGITVENACDVLVIAARLGDHNFVKEVSGFIRNKKLPSTSEHWPDFCSRYPLLANKVLNRNAGKPIKETLYESSEKRPNRRENRLDARKTIERPKRKHSMELRTSAAKLQKLL